MISQVKVFDGDGNLKRIISDKEMQGRFDKGNSMIATSLKKDINLNNSRSAEKINKECLQCGTPFKGNRRAKHCSLPCQTKYKSKLDGENMKAKAVAIHFAHEEDGVLKRICDKRTPETEHERTRMRITPDEVTCRKCLKTRKVRSIEWKQS